MIFESSATTWRSVVTIIGLTSISVASSASADVVELHQQLGDAVGDVLVDAGVDRDLPRCVGGELLAGLDVALDQRRRVGLGDLLDVHPAHPREHRQQLLLGAVEDDRRVVLGVDLRGLLDPHLVDREPADVHAEDRLGVLQGLLAIVGDLDPAGLAALADPHLRLDHARIADLLGGLDRVGNGVGVPPLGTGTPCLANSCLP